MLGVYNSMFAVTLTAADSGAEGVLDQELKRLAHIYLSQVCTLSVTCCKLYPNGIVSLHI